MSAELKPGAKGFYVPGPEHAHMVGRDGEKQFHFVHARDGSPVDAQTAGAFQMIDEKLHTGSGHPIKLGAPRNRWPAWVVAVNADGTVDIEAADPKCFTPDTVADIKRERLYIRHHMPDRENHPNAPGVPVDPTGKRPHSFHLEE